MVQKYPVSILFFTVILDLIGLNILIPIVPQLLANPSSQHYLLNLDAPLSQGYLLLGFLMATYSIGQFFMAPVFGQLSDKLGRKPVLLWSIMASGIGYALFAIGVQFRSIWLLFFARALTGITSGNIAVAQASIGDLSDASNRTRNFGIVGAAFGIGLILGPFLGGILADPKIVSWFNAATPFWFATFLSLLNALFILTMFKETHKQKNSNVAIAFDRAFHSIFHAWSLEKLRPVFITKFLYVSGFVFFTSFFTVHLIYQFDYKESQIGNYFAFLGFCVVFTQGIITKFVSQYVKEETVLKYSLFLTALSILNLLFIPSSLYLYVNAPFFAIAIGLSMANMTALISKRAGAELQGETMGLNGSLMALAGILPLLSSGFIAGTFSPDMPLWIASFVMFLSGIYFLTHIGVKEKSKVLKD